MTYSVVIKGITPFSGKSAAKLTIAAFKAEPIPFSEGNASPIFSIFISGPTPYHLTLVGLVLA